MAIDHSGPYARIPVQHMEPDMACRGAARSCMDARTLRITQSRSRLAICDPRRGTEDASLAAEEETPSATLEGFESLKAEVWNMVVDGERHDHSYCFAFQMDSYP